MTDDPRPWLRCQCVYRHVADMDDPHHGWPDDYYDRCGAQATQEDGLCDHCREPFAPGVGCGGEGHTGRRVAWCCRARLGIVRRVEDPAGPCLDKRVPTEADR